jgi:hypothetical protein
MDGIEIMKEWVNTAKIDEKNEKNIDLLNLLLVCLNKLPISYDILKKTRVLLSFCLFKHIILAWERYQ